MAFAFAQFRTLALEERGCEDSRLYPEEPIRCLRPTRVAFPREVQHDEAAQREASTGVASRGTRAFACLRRRVLAPSDAVQPTPGTRQRASGAHHAPPAASISCPAPCTRLAHVCIGHETRCNALQRRARGLRAREMRLPHASISMRKGHDLLLHRARRCVRARGHLCGENPTCAGSDAPAGGAHLTRAR